MHFCAQGLPWGHHPDAIARNGQMSMALLYMGRPVTRLRLTSPSNQSPLRQRAHSPYHPNAPAFHPCLARPPNTSLPRMSRKARRERYGQQSLEFRRRPSHVLRPHAGTGRCGLRRKYNVRPRGPSRHSRGSLPLSSAAGPAPRRRQAATRGRRSRTDPRPAAPSPAEHHSTELPARCSSLRA